MKDSRRRCTAVRRATPIAERIAGRGSRCHSKTQARRNGTDVDKVSQTTPGSSPWLSLRRS